MGDSNVEVPRVEGSALFPRKALPAPGRIAWVRVGGTIVGPEPEPASIAPGVAGVASWLVLSQLGNVFGPIRVAPRGSHLDIMVEGRLVRTRLEGLDFRAETAFTSSSLPSPLPTGFEALVEGADPRDGSFIVSELVAERGEHVQLHGVVEALAHVDAGYRAAATPPAPFVVRLDLGPCTLRARSPFG